MRTFESSVLETGVHHHAAAETQIAASRPGALCLLTPDDLETLRNAFAKGEVPHDFNTKLKKLAGDTLLHQFVEQNCRLFMALLMAVEHGSFREGTRAEHERLLQVLAYVKKDNDAIPDYKPNGFLDDQREVRAATTEMSGLLQSFKAWRLRHQVPGMWL
jgi:hypothetical protein